MSKSAPVKEGALPGARATFNGLTAYLNLMPRSAEAAAETGVCLFAELTVKNLSDKTLALNWTAEIRLPDGKTLPLLLNGESRENDAAWDGTLAPNATFEGRLATRNGPIEVTSNTKVQCSVTLTSGTETLTLVSEPTLVDEAH